MRIVTAGSAYVDIDAYAGVVAYAELLQAQGHEARAVSTAPFNESISATVRSWHAPLYTSYTPSASDTYTLIDLSDPAYFDKIVAHERVVEVIDHHTGFEEYWRERLGDTARIEFIGAACTLVYERWKAAGLLDTMSVLSARLLICGILDNTLNFGARVTTDRDIEAYNTLLARADLPNDWTAHYFTECQEAIMQDAVTAIRNDTKTVSFPSFPSFPQPICFSQLVVWDAKQVLDAHEDALRSAMARMQPYWFMNIISVGERTSYFVSDNTNVQAWLTRLLDVQFTTATTAIADRLWLRKEIRKQDGC